MLGILGTELRTNCVCKGTELAQLYNCLGWQRLIWVNPCVGKRKIPGLGLITHEPENSVPTMEANSLRWHLISELIDYMCLFNFFSQLYYKDIYVPEKFTTTGLYLSQEEIFLGRTSSYTFLGLSNFPHVICLYILLGTINYYIVL